MCITNNMATDEERKGVDNYTGFITFAFERIKIEVSKRVFGPENITKQWPAALMLAC